MTRTELALHYFKTGSSCAQAILTAFAPDLGVDAKTAHKMASGLGGGLGRKQYVCGAINAAAIVIGLRYGNSEPDEHGTKEKTYTIVREFIDELEEELGSSSCRELLGIPILTDEDVEKAIEKDVFNTICTECVKKTAEKLDKIL
jgi:C_GCAxxG_C_C family probable redox protein